MSRNSIQECTECGDEFDSQSQAKRDAGGLISHCPECSNETATKVLGLAAGDGKGNSVSIIRAENEADRRKLLHYWQRASGLHRGKSCQLGERVTAPGVKFETVTQSEATNHKGKL